MILRTLHRTSAFVVLLFAGVHIFNHLLSLSSIELHITFMEAARTVYRAPVIEPVLLSCVMFQVGSGAWMVVRGWHQRYGLVAWLQALSGLILAVFLLIHVAAVMFGRIGLGLDTNFYFAAAGFHVPPYQYFFAPYYFLAVWALFTHLACALYWWTKPSTATRRAAVIVIPMLMGAIVSLAIVLSLGGHLSAFEVPAQYRATYGKN